MIDRNHPLSVSRHIGQKSPSHLIESIPSTQSSHLLSNLMISPWSELMRLMGSSCIKTSQTQPTTPLDNQTTHQLLTIDLKD